MARKRTGEDIVAIGLDLKEIKERLGEGSFSSFIQDEFEMSKSSAARFIQVADKFADRCPKLGHLNPSILYLLASPSTTESVVEDVVSGKIVAKEKEVKEAIKAAQLAKEQKELAERRIAELNGIINQYEATQKLNLSSVLS